MNASARSSPSASPIIFWLNSPASVYTIGLQPHKSRPKRSLIIELLTNSQQTHSSYFPATTPQRAAGVADQQYNGQKFEVLAPGMCFLRRGHCVVSLHNSSLPLLPLSVEARCRAVGEARNKHPFAVVGCVDSRRVETQTSGW